MSRYIDAFFFCGENNVEHSDRVIEGLQLISVEFPKLQPQTFAGKRMQVWPDTNFLGYFSTEKHFIIAQVTEFSPEGIADLT